MQNAQAKGDLPTIDGYPAGSVSLAANARTDLAASRILFIDNIRWVMILLVLSMHAAVTYSPVGDWYYREHVSLGPISTVFFVTYQGVLQGFFMALLFFIAGYFVPRSYDAKGAASFMAGRLYRLGSPTMLFVVLLGPVTEYYVVHSWDTQQSFTHELGLYFAQARFLSGTGPMWFCAALLIFSGVYAGYRAIGSSVAPRPSGGRQIKAAGVMLTIAAMAVSTFLIRIVMPLGTSVFNMQLCYFPSYVIMFSLGVAAARERWIEEVADRLAWTTAGLCSGAAMLAWLPLLILGGALRGQSEAFAGGLHWQSAALSLWEALICAGMSFGVLAGFRARLSRQGRFSRYMSDNAFAVYVIHPPILIGIAILLAGVPLPPVTKFAALWVLSALACFGCAAPLARRIPILRRILH
ncbi:MAG: acyltransferase family protein [Devosia sp.]